MLCSIMRSDATTGANSDHHATSEKQPPNRKAKSFRETRIGKLAVVECMHGGGAAEASSSSNTDFEITQSTCVIVFVRVGMRGLVLRSAPLCDPVGQRSDCDQRST
jgi:hypothetical protein